MPEDDRPTRRTEPPEVPPSVDPPPGGDRLYRLMVESADHYAILTLDLEGRITTWNRGAVNLFGWTLQEALGQASDLIFTEEDRAADVPGQELQKAYETGTANDDRWQQRKDGSRFWANGLVHALDWQGERRGFVKILRDDTARRRAEEDLRRLNETLEERIERRTQEVREQEERFRKLVETSAAIVWTTGAAGEVRSGSRSWTAFTGQGDEQSEGEGWLDAVHPDDRAVAEGIWADSIRSGEAVDSEYRVFHAPSGTWRWTNVRAVPLLDEGGATRGWLGMNIDIDERRRGEERVRDMASRLAMAEQKERSRLAHVLHDDLQQQLYAIQLRAAATTQAAAEGDLETVVEHSRQIEEWLDEAMQRTRQLSVDLNPPLLKGESLQDGLHWLTAQMQDVHRLRIDLRIGEEPVRLANEEMKSFLLRALRELLFNVVKHAGVDRASVGVERAPGHLTLAVEDRGQGFDPTGIHANGGFGLANMRERLGLFGGRLEIESTPGSGTRVVLSIPLNETDGG